MPPPGVCVAEALSSAEMYLNRVLMEFRQTAPEHKSWVAAMKKCMQAIQALAEANCPHGLVWSATAQSSTVGSAPGKPAAGVSDSQHVT
jgi:hypothetical protein